MRKFGLMPVTLIMALKTIGGFISGSGIAHQITVGWLCNYFSL